MLVPNRFTGESIGEFDISPGADLYEAKLRGANLRGVVGDQKYLKSLFLDRWPITYTWDTLQIGCENHLIAEWKKFSDDRINAMDPGALEWWKKYKELIFMAIEISPALKPDLSWMDEKTEAK